MSFDGARPSLFPGTAKTRLWTSKQTLKEGGTVGGRGVSRVWAWAQGRTAQPREEGHMQTPEGVAASVGAVAASSPCSGSPNPPSSLRRRVLYGLYLTDGDTEAT